MTEILTTEQMYRADQLAVDDGVSATQLMQTAGRAVVDVIRDVYDRQPVLVLAGPGNNGGDGFVIARSLLEQGWMVRLCFVGDAEKLSEEARFAYQRFPWQKLKIEELGEIEEPLVVDALFGAGLRRAITSPLSNLIEDLNRSGNSTKFNTR